MSRYEPEYQCAWQRDSAIRQRHDPQATQFQRSHNTIAELTAGENVRHIQSE
jgi:hypothetical protein